MAAEDVTALYQQLFNRAPDPGGLTAWTNEMAAHPERSDWAAQMVQAAGPGDVIAHRAAGELITPGMDPNAEGYGLTKAQGVTALYQQLFNRAPDPGGLTTWTNEMAAHPERSDWAAQMMQAAGPNDVIAHQAAGELITPGMDPTAAAYGLTKAQDVTALYQQLFNRAPDPGGLTAWTNEMAAHPERSDWASQMKQAAGPGDVIAHRAAGELITPGMDPTAAAYGLTAAQQLARAKELVYGPIRAREAAEAAAAPAKAAAAKGGIADLYQNTASPAYVPSPVAMPIPQQWNLDPQRLQQLQQMMDAQQAVAAPQMTVQPPNASTGRPLNILPAQAPVGFAYGGMVGQQNPMMGQQNPMMGQQNPMMGQQPAQLGQPSLLGNQSPMGQQPAMTQPFGWTPYGGQAN